MDKQLFLDALNFTKQLLIDYKIVLGFVAYSAMEYWFGRTDKIKEGSFMEFVWARVKGLFMASKGIPPQQ